jgi:Rrf2 family nitric oxide-sensitive transcriptional repressor
MNKPAVFKRPRESGACPFEKDFSAFDAYRDVFMPVVRFTHHATHVLASLAMEKDRTITVREIAERQGMSRSQVARLVRDLRQAGCVETLRGRNGGLRLCVDPEQINLGALVRQAQPDVRVAECFGNHNDCRATTACNFRQVFGEAIEEFLATLDKYTLSHFLKEKKASVLHLFDPS